jgi:hypothetical protein
MIPSVYIVGGAGVGKSTFTAELLIDLGVSLGEPEILHSKRNRINLVHLKGQPLSDGGVYLGKMRPDFPGTDGLDKVCQPAALEWVETQEIPYRYILAEGARLMTKAFLPALEARTDLILVHLVLDEETRLGRLERRGAGQPATFLKGSLTGSARAAASVGRVLTIDTGDEFQWGLGLDICLKHLSGKH